MRNLKAIESISLRNLVYQVLNFNVKLYEKIIIIIKIIIIENYIIESILKFVVSKTNASINF